MRARIRKERDDFVAGVFDAAGLALLRVRVQRSYEPQELAALVEPFLSSQAVDAVPLAVPLPAAEQAAPTTLSPANGEGEQNMAPAPPRCPKCGDEMVLRTARRGDNQGQQFWGCPNFPRCCATMPYEDAYPVGQERYRAEV